MPTTEIVGTPSANNDKIGGVPTMHYFDFQSRGRGQVVRIFWEDAGIAYKDIRYSFQEWPQAQESLLRINPVGKIPIVELNGQILTQSYPILRRFARQLGEYDGTTEEEKYWVDVMCDIAIDWRTEYVNVFMSGSEERKTQHCWGSRLKYLEGLESQLKSNDFSKKGPFVLGDRITYADFVIYQVTHDEELTKDERTGLKGFPRLTKLVEAVEARPNVQAFLKGDRYKG
ncbi:MAG: hypothetical protein M1814_006725 [Vezdaea aestivalis]|nr:MAG: hypothetical protein M1814_006725 [Vezdaea aestivalis]